MKFRFILFDCYAMANGVHISMYDNYCPNEDLGLVWNNFESFNFHLFRIDQSNKFQLACNVAIFSTKTELPNNCDTNHSNVENNMNAIATVFTDISLNAG